MNLSAQSGISGTSWITQKKKSIKELIYMFCCCLIPQTIPRHVVVRIHEKESSPSLTEMRTPVKRTALRMKKSETEGIEESQREYEQSRESSVTFGLVEEKLIEPTSNFCCNCRIFCKKILRLNSSNDSYVVVYDLPQDRSSNQKSMREIHIFRSKNSNSEDTETLSEKSSKKKFDATDVQKKVIEIQKKKLFILKNNVLGSINDDRVTKFQQWINFTKSFNDPNIDKQWHLLNVRNLNNFSNDHQNYLFGYDLNVVDVWFRSGITGRNVIIQLIDDGIDETHPEIQPNYLPYPFSYDYVSGQKHLSLPQNDNSHGTRCAGEIIAKDNNNKCGIGISYSSKLFALHLISDYTNDLIEAHAFTHAIGRFMKGSEETSSDIITCSWGPIDDGHVIHGPGSLSISALQFVQNYGRRGYGSVLLFSSGNGKKRFDDCNYDGYVNNIYTISVGAVHEHGRTTTFSEGCSSLTVVAFSGDKQLRKNRYDNTLSSIIRKQIEDTHLLDWTESINRSYRQISTTGYHSKKGSYCDNNYSGTSAATPMIAGVIALMLEANNRLSSKDIQFILMLTSRHVLEECDENFQRVMKEKNSIKLSSPVQLMKFYTKLLKDKCLIPNDFHLYHSRNYGFGIVDANASVTIARDKWKGNMPFTISMKIKPSETNSKSDNLVYMNNCTKLFFNPDEYEVEFVYGIKFIENVQLNLNLEIKPSYCRGDFFILLQCPSGTTSILGSQRLFDCNIGRKEFTNTNYQNINNWSFSTIKCWGEGANGQFAVAICHQSMFDNMSRNPNKNSIVGRIRNSKNGRTDSQLFSFEL
ncbi:hypothetical protein SNEBB_000715 [Seison nebaliae]|nr:hypothetical protein SNEBB_000715 [Seison nebaliae]